MSLVSTHYQHIVIDEKGVPIIAGTTTKVIELVVEKIAYGWSPEELHLQHPYLTLGQIYSAFAYYSDHIQELDQDIERRLENVERLQQSPRSSPLIRRLKSKSAL